MSVDWVADVLAFHEKFGCHVGKTPCNPLNSTRDLRLSLIDEEHGELHDAVGARDLIGVADSIVDLIYVLVGMALAYGIDLRPVWDAVQAANMAKEGGGSRGDGKILKPPGWEPPDVAAILAAQGPLGEVR